MSKRQTMAILPRHPSVPLSPAAFRARIHVRVSLIYWLTLSGLFVWTVLIAFQWVDGAPPLVLKPFLWVLFGAALNLAARSWVRLTRGRRAEGDALGNRLGWLFVTIDMILIAVGLQTSGGFQSPLWVVVFLVGGAETILATPAEAYLIRYGAILALLLGTLPHPMHQVTSAYYLEMGVRVGCFLAVSSVTRRLRETNDSKERENAALRAELALTEERSHLSREIHDGVGNSLAAAVLRLEVAARVLDKTNRESSGETVAMLKDEAQALRDAMSAVRDWTFFTRPWPTDDVANQLPSARLMVEIERLSQRTGLAMKIDGAQVINETPAVARLAVIRIIQESLTNAAKHATEATYARVTLQREGTHLFLTVMDDGAGFNDSTGTGVGIASMRDRAEGLGGTLTYTTSINKRGVTITARLPLY